MGKYKQWLHHQEVGARLRDEIAAHEAEREQVLKLAPAKATPLPDRSNPIIAALLGQASVLKASEPPAAQGSRNGSGTTAAAAVATTASEAAAEGRTNKDGAGATGAKVVTASKAAEASGQAPKGEAQSTQEETATAKPAATNKPKPAAAPARAPAEKPAAAPVAPAAPDPQPDTIDPLLEQLLAQAESAPADPLEALNLLASQGPDLTHGEAPLPIGPASSAPLSPPAGLTSTVPGGPLNQPGGAAPMLPTAPLNSSNASDEQSALKTLLGEAKPTAEPQKSSASASTSAAVGVETATATEVSVRAESVTRVEKGRSDTDELVASRPTEGYTEPRLIVPQWLRSMELGQEGNTSGSAPEEADNKQRFSVSLPFENEEDMRLHESVERWWQRWRQQG